ncbi:MAG: T9SS type A sorting domain-containing protein [Bacteroidota bacterium]
MKKFTLVLLCILMASASSFAQKGFIFGYSTAEFHRVNLATSVTNYLGASLTSIGGMDFGDNSILYAVNSSSDNFYQVDTSNGVTTTISNMSPALFNHIWTGMAYDPATGIMYGISCNDGVESALHSIDCSIGSSTLIGTMDTASSIACIAIDSSGQLYGMNRSGSNASIYLIDKATGAATLLGYTGQNASGEGHGMDFCPVNNTMYLTTHYPATSQNQLCTVDLNTGTISIVGYQANIKSALAVRPYLQAAFSSDNTIVCQGDTVNFTAPSNGATAWSWSFEGGTPATSTVQNPSVVYTTQGTYDVSLTVSNASYAASDTVTDMITVNQFPVQATTPTGEVSCCSNVDYTYTTLSVPTATDYIWEVLPADAGTITGTDTSALFVPSETWNGAYTIKVKAENNCGIGPWSPELSCTLYTAPEPFYMEGGGSYCQDSTGSEVTLAGSETGVDYELYLDDVTTGTIIAGTGSPISFGYQTGEGFYSSVGSLANCSAEMLGEAYVFVVTAPGQGTQPSGPEDVCTGTTTDYQTDPVTDADTLIWMLNPEESGVISGSGENISITWSGGNKGSALLSVYGSNECGEGLPSDELEIVISTTPTPEVSGDTLVCEDEQHIYSTLNTPDHTYYWAVAGGDIVAGTGTSEIDILWIIPGNGYVVVTEISADDCEATSDTLEVIIDECIGIDEISKRELSVYPNPASETITISLESAIAIEGVMRIYNMLGQVVCQTNLNLNKGNMSEKINIASLKAGSYILTITASDNYLKRMNLQVY